MRDFSSRIIRFKEGNFTPNQWGGRWIPDMKGLNWDSNNPVGESWEFSGHHNHPSLVLPPNDTPIELPKVVPDLPFLIKFIDANEDLSLQVHPNDDLARSYNNDSGKEESWIVLDAGSSPEEGAIYIGFSEKINGAENEFKEVLNAAVKRGPTDDPKIQKEIGDTILPFINKVKVKPGDVFDLEAGTIHAVGRGVRLYEIQQTSDVTYRVWDWNRPDEKLKDQGKNVSRELHIGRALEVLDLKGSSVDSFRPESKKVSTKGKGDIKESILVENKKGRYALNRINLGNQNDQWESVLKNPFVVLTCIAGSATLNTQSPTENDEEILTKGKTVMIPGGVKKYSLTAIKPGVEILKAYIP